MDSLCFYFNGFFVILSEIKERIKKTRDEKKAEKVKLMAKTQSKGRHKGVAPKGPKLGGGGGGKR